jgi:putative CocE/NonD family hydrolase
VPSLYELRWLEGVSGRVRYRELISDTEQWNRHAAAGFVSGDPDDVRRAAGLPDTRYAHQVFETLDWEAHGFVPAAEAFRDCDLPVLSTTGQYDSCMLGALWQHERYLEHASTSARRASTLLIGPWDHGCESSSGPAHAADLQFGPDAAVDLRRLHLEWFDWVMRGGRRPAFLDVPVRYFVTGEERWRAAASLPEATRSTSHRFLVSAPPPNDVFHSGWIATTPAGGPDYRIDADAGDMRTVEVELTERPDAVPIGASDEPAPFHDLFATVGGDQPTDQAFSVALEGQGVVYHSSIVGESLAIVGRPRLRLQLSIETPATPVQIDLVALLHEVRDDASAILLSSDMRRLALDSARTEVELDSWRFTARVLERSSRVRLTVRVAQSLWWARPPSAPAHVVLRVHHDERATPALWLPLGDVDAE